MHYIHVTRMSFKNLLLHMHVHVPYVTMYMHRTMTTHTCAYHLKQPVLPYTQTNTQTENHSSSSSDSSNNFSLSEKPFLGIPISGIDTLSSPLLPPVIARGKYLLTDL